ncbi:hypothetical protein GCM10010441_52300 [Kitasatospora paracochleata]|uniref:Uncharacterized protein n=1 Tax=Kitasatospora paracochleata TaxID=58354 RepID=A0ABT1JB17_9ACTN|nr:hypothetical protein [Kitasatospora paracochleata]MCP2314647.1 hypothetical protein [Kitasatospora paracochleata]
MGRRDFAGGKADSGGVGVAANEMIIMEYSRSEVIATLQRAGYSEEAEEALHELPDPVDQDRLAAWGQEHGITRDGLISRMGGSP